MTLNCKAVLQGEEGVTEFFARTRADWERIARYLMARVPVAEGVEEADVVQELQIAAWKVLGKFDARRGTSPNAYVMFNAIVRAKRWLVRQQRRGGRGGMAPLVSAEAQLDADRPQQEPAQLPDQDDRIESKEELSALLDACASIRSRIVLVAAWKHGSVDAASQAIYEDPELRRLCRLDCRGDARRVVVKEIQRATRNP